MAVSDESAAVLEEALVLYDQFATQNASNPRLQHDTADAHRRMGEIYERLGEYGKAEKAFGRAVEIYEFQPRQPVKDADLTCLRASTLNQLGRVEKMLGRFKDARDHFGRARLVLEESSDDSSQARYELARTHGNLAGVMWHLGKPEEGGRSDRQAVQLLEQLVSEHPKNAEYRLALARAYCRYHPALAGDIDGRKREWFRTEAVAAIEALVDEFPQVPDYRCELSETLATISLEILGPGGGPNPLERHAAAESLLRRALEQAEGIAEEYPEIPRYRAVLARAQKDLAWLLHITNRSHRAEFRLAEAVAIYEDLWREFPDVEVYQFLLAMALESQGNVLRHTGHLSESRQAIDRSIEQLRSYMAARPQSAFCQGILAHHYDSLAETLKLLGAEEEAAEAARQAKEMRQIAKDALEPKRDGGNQDGANQRPAI